MTDLALFIKSCNIENKGIFLEAMMAQQYLDLEFQPKRTHVENQYLRAVARIKWIISHTNQITYKKKQIQIQQTLLDIQVLTELHKKNENELIQELSKKILFILSDEQEPIQLTQDELSEDEEEIPIGYQLYLPSNSFCMNRVDTKPESIKTPKEKLNTIHFIIKDACELCTHKDNVFKKFIAALVHIVTLGHIKYAHRLNYDGLFGKTKAGLDFELIERLTAHANSPK